MKFSLQELIKIGEAHLQSGWDIFPDDWEERQVQECLQLGKLPRWKYMDSTDRVVADYSYL